MTSSSEITLENARDIAREQALFNLSTFMAGERDVLAADYLEAEHCWMFFRNRKIHVPKTALLGIEWAYVVSKRGKFSMVEDFSSDNEKLLDYLKTMSDYFSRKEE